MSKSKYEDDTGTGGWVDENEAKVAASAESAEEKARREVREKAVAEEERAAKEADELRQKETVKAKLVRLVGALQGGLTGTARDMAFKDLKGAVQSLKTEETVGDAERERKALEEKAEKGEKAGKF